MHQHPRSPAPAAPTFPTRSNSIRPEDQREQVVGPNSPTLDTRPHNSKGLGIETGSDMADQAQKNTPPAKEAMAKLNQIIANYHTKAALIILHSRVELPPSFNKGSDTPKVNRWFNVELEDTDVLREQLRTWRTCDATENRPPPLTIETYLDTKGLTNNQSLVALDENGKRWDVLESLAASRESYSIKPSQAKSDDIILERWTVELGDTSSKPPADLGSILPTVYKKSILLFRSLVTYSKFLPAWKFAKRNGKRRSNPALQIKYRIVEGRKADGSRPDHLTIPLFENNGKVVDTYSFGVTDSPAGPFSVQVSYRTSCDFRVDDSEALLSSRFMGADDEIFRPSIPSGDLHGSPAHEVGSVPLAKRTVANPDPSRAYGSLSTFHHVGPPTGASPISALRAARESGATSPSPTDSPSRKLMANKMAPAGRAAALAGEGGSGHGRRSSISFQPFKAPPLSASPSLVDPPLGVSPRSASLRAPSSDSKNMPPPSMAASARKIVAAPSDNVISSTSASPRPSSISRYSSAFSHRRGRPSSGGINRIEDDNSSGKVSAASSSAQPGSGLLAEPTGTSADSIHADDENISEFLKMLDSRKDLMNPTSSTALDSTARRTTVTSAALTRFQRMRDSNAALSDSMSSSLLMHRSSNSSSKQLSGVPPMVAGTSISTASSPGKPISPHTPHTPAIPSRLSSNSIAQYSEVEQPDSLPEPTASDETAAPPNAIDIPISPRIFAQPYRRSSSAVQRQRSIPNDDDEIFPFGMRSVSLGAEDRSNVSLGARQRQQDLEAGAARTGQSQRDARPSSINDESAGPSGSARVAPTSGPTGTSLSSNHHVYQPRFSHRGRGSFGNHSLSSASSSLARNATIPPHFTEREHDRDGNASGSNSGHSTMEARRGSGQRSISGRAYPPHTNPTPDEDEPLLFAMSDFGVPRRSSEEGRHESGGATAGPRRSSVRRGAGLSGFPAWS